MGTYTLQVRAIDLALNVDDTPASITWTVVPPVDTTLGQTPVDPTDQTTATFTFTANQDGAGFQCALDTQLELETVLWTACDSGSVTYNDLAAGEHEFAVRAKASEENVDASPATFSWQIGDITPRVITVTQGPGDASGAEVTNETTAVFSFESVPPLPAGTIFQCTLSGGTPHPCASGEYTVTEAEPAAGQQRHPVGRVLVRGLRCSRPEPARRAAGRGPTSGRSSTRSHPRRPS